MRFLSALAVVLATVSGSAAQEFRGAITGRIDDRSGGVPGVKFLNALNRPVYANPNTDPTNADFGKVTSQTNLPRDISARGHTDFLGGSMRTLAAFVLVLYLFDRAHFANPGNTFGTAAFGQISATRLTSREAQLGFRFLF